MRGTMNHLSRWTLFACILFSVLSLYSVGSDIPSDLSKYLRIAEENNHGLKAAYEKWKAAETISIQAGSLPDPVMNFSYFIQEVETRVGPQKKNVGISQRFPLGGKRKILSKKASAAARADWIKIQTMRLAVAERVRTAYYEYAYLARSIAITKELNLLLSQLVEVAEVRFQSGTGTQSAVIQIQVELAKLEDRINSLEALRPVRSALLAAELNDPGLKGLLPWPAANKPVKLIGGMGRFEKELKLNNPEILVYDHVSETARLDIDLARKRRVPDLTVGLSAIETGKRIDAHPYDDGKDPFAVNFSFNLPVRSKAYTASENEARHRFLAAKHSRKEVQERLLADLQLTIYRFEDSSRKISLYRDSLLPKAEQALQVSQEGFINGNADFLHIIDSVRTILEFQLAYDRAIADQKIAVAHLEKLTGKTIPVQPEIPPGVKTSDHGVSNGVSK